MGNFCKATSKVSNFKASVNLWKFSWHFFSMQNAAFQKSQKDQCLFIENGEFQQVFCAFRASFYWKFFILFCIQIKERDSIFQSICWHEFRMNSLIEYIAFGSNTIEKFKAKTFSIASDIDTTKIKNEQVADCRSCQKNRSLHFLRHLRIQKEWWIKVKNYILHFSLIFHFVFNQWFNF